MFTVVITRARQMVTGPAADISDSDCHWLPHCTECQGWWASGGGDIALPTLTAGKHWHCQPLPEWALACALAATRLRSAPLSSVSGLAAHNTWHTSHITGLSHRRRSNMTQLATSSWLFASIFNLLSYHCYNLFWVALTGAVKVQGRYMLCLMKGNNISRSGSMSKDNGCEIKFNICGYFPASENPREITEHRVMCQLWSISRS